MHGGWDRRAEKNQVGGPFAATSYPASSGLAARSLRIREGLTMANTSATVLTLLIAWALLLVVLMEVLRGRLVANGRIAGNQFRPDNSNLSPFMQRLARAHANCIEGLPIFGGLLVVALLTNRTGVTDALAPWLLLARFVQSVAHLSSRSNFAVNIRFIAFVAQLVIALYWVWALLVH